MAEVENQTSNNEQNENDRTNPHLKDSLTLEGKEYFVFFCFFLAAKEFCYILIFLNLLKDLPHGTNVI